MHAIQFCILKHKCAAAIRAMPGSGKTRCTSNGYDALNTNGLLLALADNVDGNAVHRVLTDGEWAK